MYGGQSTAAGAGALGAGAAGVVGAEDRSLRDDDHVLAAELLLQLPYEAGLDLVEVLQQAEGDEDDDGLLASGNINLQNHESHNRQSTHS